MFLPDSSLTVAIEVTLDRLEIRPGQFVGGGMRYLAQMGLFIGVAGWLVSGCDMENVDVISGVDNDNDGYTVDEDCDDNDPATHNGAAELCDGVDNDCDGTLPGDEADNDGDGYQICDNDCDDADGAVHPAATGHQPTVPHVRGRDRVGLFDDPGQRRPGEYQHACPRDYL